MADRNDSLSMEQIAAILTDETADSPDEVFRRCRALEQLAASGPNAIVTLPAIMRSLVVAVTVDCFLWLRGCSRRGSLEGRLATRFGTTDSRLGFKG